MASPTVEVVQNDSYSPKNSPIGPSTPDATPTSPIIAHSCKDIVEEKIITKYGSVAVHVFGDRTRPIIITYHDLGLNALACFQNFFEFGEMSSLIDKFCVYNINAPGQEENADPLPESFVYPTMEELAETVAAVVHHFCIKSFIGLGVGAGANVLCRYALEHPKIVDALILINCTCSTSGWIEWGYQKANIFYLRSRGSNLTSLKVDYLMWHYFGRSSDHCDKTLIDGFRTYFNNLPNPRNVSLLIDSFVKRSALNIRRAGPTLGCPVLQIVGADSPHVNDTIDVNQRLDPTKSDWLKVSDCSGLVLEQQPVKVAEAILLFLQGQGHIPAVSHVRFAARRPSTSSQSQQQRSMSVCPMTMHKVSVNVQQQRSNEAPNILSSTAKSLPTSGSDAKRRSHSIATPGGGGQQEMMDNSLFKLFDSYQINRSKKDTSRLESTLEESGPSEEVVVKSNAEMNGAKEPPA